MGNRVIEYIYKIRDHYTKKAYTMANATKQLSKDIDRGKKSLKKFNKSLKKLGKKAAIAGIAGLGAAFMKATKEARGIEDAKAAFTPVMGGAEKAQKLVDRLNKEAATTPFQFQTIAQASKRFLPLVGGDIDKAAGLFRMLGDTAGGNANNLVSLSRAYSKVLGKGKANMLELNMIQNAGVPILAEIEKRYGYNTEKIYELSAAGKLSEEIITGAFKSMTSEGGIFYNGMDIASKTLSGRLSTLRDNIDLAFAALGQTFLPILKKAVRDITENAKAIKAWAEANKEVIKTKIEAFLKQFVKYVKIGSKILKILGSIIVKVVKFLKPFSPIIIGIVVAWKAYRVAMMIAAAAQVIFNTAMSANPIGITITAIGILIGLIYIFRKQILAVGKVVFKALEILYPPFGIVVDFIKTIIEQWNYVKAAFTVGGFGKGLLAIGKALYKAVLRPIQAVLEAASKIPGIGKWAKQGAEKIAKMRGDLFPDEKVTNKRLKGSINAVLDIAQGAKEEYQRSLGPDVDTKKVHEKIEKVKKHTQDAGKKIGQFSGEQMQLAARNMELQQRYVSAPKVVQTQKQPTTKVDANMNLSVFTENNMKVVPFQKTGNLGYNMGAK